MIQVQGLMIVQISKLRMQNIIEYLSTITHRFLLISIVPVCVCVSGCMPSLLLCSFDFLQSSNYYLSIIFLSSHGTRCAGASSGKANNGMCGVGVAYNSNIAGKK